MNLNQLLLLTLLLPATPQNLTSSRVVITFQTRADNLASNADLVNATVVKRYGRRLVLDLRRPFDLVEEADAMRSVMLAVERVEMDYLVSVDASVNEIVNGIVNGIVNETLYSDSSDTIVVQQDYSGAVPPLTQWNLKDSEPYSIHAEKVWTLSNSTPDVIVAVIDTGLATPARAYFLHVVDGYDFISDADLALDWDGRDPDATDPGDWGDSCPTPSWHGTRVASILAARHDNKFGMRGVAQNCSVMPVRVLGLCKMGYANDVTDAIVWAAGGRIDGVPTNPLPAKILSLSLAGQGSCPSYMQSAIDTAISLGSVVITAAGNNNKDASGYFPANCKGVIAVAASTRQGTLAGYSNYGNLVTLSAPGGDSSNPIMTLRVNAAESDLQIFNGVGTSFAVPHVTAAAAIFYGILPINRNRNIKYLLTLQQSIIQCQGQPQCSPGISTLQLLCNFHDASFYLQLSDLPMNVFNQSNYTSQPRMNSFKRYFEIDYQSNIAKFVDHIDERILTDNTNYKSNVKKLNISYNDSEYQLNITHKYVQADNLTVHGRSTSCTAGFYLAIPSYVCTRCDQGSYSLNGFSGSACLLCSPGKYLRSSVEECDSCAAGYYLPFQGMWLPMKFTYSHQYLSFLSGDYHMTSMFIDNYRQFSYRKKYDCMYDFLNYYGVYVFAQCETAEEYDQVVFADIWSPSRATNKAYCLECNRGTYTMSVASSTCLNCIAGKYNTIAKASSASVCIDCDMGRYNNLHASGWPVTFYWRPTPNNVFLESDAGFDDLFQINNALTINGLPTYIKKNKCLVYTEKYECWCLVDKNCEVTTWYYDKIDALQTPTISYPKYCYNCNAGTYSDVSGASKCSNCPRGTFSTAIGATLASTCLKCATGKYSERYAVGWPQQLTISYTNTMYFLSQTDYFSGLYIMNEFAVNGYPTFSATFRSICMWYSPVMAIWVTWETCTDSINGGYYNGYNGFYDWYVPDISNVITSRVFCFDCPIGKYAMNEGSTICSECASGKYSSATGSSACKSCTLLTCDAGKYRLCTLTANSVCLDCDPKPNGAIWTGIDCNWECESPHYYKTGTNVCSPCTAQVPCSLGYYFKLCSDYENSACTACAAKASNSIYIPVADDVCAWQCNAGYFNADGGLFCNACNAGSYSDGLRECSACAAGKYASSVPASTCTLCQAGLYQTITGATVSSACLSCIKGSYSSVTGLTSSGGCISCDKGTYSSMTAATDSLQCLKCSAGTYSSLSGATASSVCLGCVKGTYSAAVGLTTSASCSSCDNGKYSTSMTANAECQFCPAGTFSLVGATVCSTCQDTVSYSLNSGSSTCTTCSSTRPVCSAGQIPTTCTTTAAISCITCASKPENSFYPSSASCEYKCMQGYFRAYNDNKCYACSTYQQKTCGVGEYFQSCVKADGSEATTNSQCVPCTNGPNSWEITYTSASDTEGVSNCGWICKNGYWKNIPSGTCDFCWDGSMAPAGSTSKDQCVWCEPGYWMTEYFYRVTETEPASADKCIPCRPGYLQPWPGMSTCGDCDAGKYQTGSAGTECTNCAAGKYSTVRNAKVASTCVACNRGYYAPNAGSAGCSVCAYPKYSVQPSGATTCIDCVPCDAGYYLNGCGASSAGTCLACTACGSGTYNPTCSGTSSGSCSNCGTCTAGNYMLGCSGTSSGECTPCSCPAGQYSVGCSGTASGTCSPCTTCPGRYNQGCTGTSSGTCTDCTCNAGQYKTSCSGTSSGTCKSCNAGYYRAAADAVSSCTACAGGKYSTIVGATSSAECSLCTSCPGQYTENCGITNSGYCADCTACDVGQYTEGCSGTSIGYCANCEVCSPGSYMLGCSGLSSGTCTPCSCSLGLYSKGCSGTSSGSCFPCTACTPGKYNIGCSGTSSGTCTFCTCPAGQYSSACSGTSITCTPCEAGYYREAADHVGSCTACGIGKYSTISGATASSACSSCNSCPNVGQYTADCGIANSGRCSSCFNVVWVDPGQVI